MENVDFEKQFEGLPTSEKVRILTESDSYKNVFNPLHRQAVGYMRELCSLPDCREPAPLPDSVNELMSHPGFNDRMHEDHKRIMEKFRQLHNIK